jgi:hypothetical protein
LVIDQADDDRFLALVGQYDELEASHRKLQAQVEELAAGVGQLTAPAATGGDPPAVPWWPLLSDDERASQWSELATWLKETIPQHLPGIAQALTKCWLDHPNVIDELTMLHATWKTAYATPGARPSEAAAWLDRWAPGVERRIQAALKECRQGHELRERPVPNL